MRAKDTHSNNPQDGNSSKNAPTLHITATRKQGQNMDDIVDPVHFKLNYEPPSVPSWSSNILSRDCEECVCDLLS